MRAQITILVSAACLLLCGTPLWARGGGSGGGFSVGGSSGRGGGYSVGGGSSSSGSSGPSIGRSDSKSDNDNDSGRGSSGSGKSSSGGSSGKGSSGGSGKVGGSSNKGADHPKKPDRADSSQQRADREGDRKQWPGRGGNQDGHGGGNGHHQPPCPNGHHDCNKHCCNHYGYGGYGWGWGYGGYNSPWPENPGSYDRNNDKRSELRNVELKLSPKEVEVYVNGVLYGTKGNAKISLPAGVWTIEIRAEGYLTETVDLEVKQGIKYKIERKLQRDPNYRPPDRDDRRTDA